MANSNIIVGGLVPFTTIDYPSKLSAVIFLQGCPWRCIYCSNPHLFEFRKATEQDKNNWQYVLDLLKKRVKILDAIVFSGGEATAQAEEIVEAIKDIKKFAPHFKFGLHTNGCFPEKLEIKAAGNVIFNVILDSTAKSPSLKKFTLRSTYPAIIIAIKQPARVNTSVIYNLLNTFT